MPINVAIVEDDPKTREGLQSVLRTAPGFECVGAYASGESALEGIPRRFPQVVLMDVNLGGMSGVECTRRLKLAAPEIQIVMLTVYDDSDRIFHALQMGASGYLLKRASADEILRAIEEVLRGGSPMSSYIARKVVQSFQRQAHPDRPMDALTQRESDVLAYVSQGHSNKEVADALGISIQTVNGYLKTIYGKLQVHSRTEAAMKYVK